MGVRILYDPEEDEGILYESVMGDAFGQTFKGGDTANGREVAQDFLTWLEIDPGRLTLTELAEERTKWEAERLDENLDLRSGENGRNE